MRRRRPGKGCEPWHGHAHGHRHGKRFFWRVYKHGVLLLLLVAGAAAGAGAIVGRAPAWKDFPERLATYLAADLERAVDDPARLAAEVARARKQLGVHVTCYGLDGSLLAAAGRSQRPLRGEELAAVRRGPVRLRWSSVAVPLRKDGEVVGYAVGTLPGTGPAAGPGGARARAGGVARARAAAPRPRPGARPLERLTEAARRLGQGDLSVRTKLRRGDEVGELSQAFDEMAERLEALVRSEKELLANVSHELRTPLARIRVALELAGEGDLAKARAYLGEIGADLAELDRLVADVLTAARLDAGLPGGSPPLRKELVPGGELVERAAERFRSAFPSRELAVELAQGLPAVEADPALLRRVIDNLLDNARKYSDGPLRLVGRASPEGLVVEVHDRGIGIDPEDLPRLFTPFFRTDRSRARGTGGVGLGLTLARRIVEAHGGRIGAESAVGEGTCVRFVVPASAPGPRAE